MKILVVGGGWYGCHIAASLEGHDVELWEASDRLFNGASGNNQNRLHLGYHYPRNGGTRDECRVGFDQFMYIYPKFTRGIRNNLYAIAEDSIIDAATYEVIFPYLRRKHGLRNVQAVYRVDERLILTSKARNWFTKNVKHEVNKRYDGGTDHDVVIDCTYGAYSYPNLSHYEACILHKVKASPNLAITVMDGPFFSLYPTEEKGISTLSHVEWTPIYKTASHKLAMKEIDRLNKKDISRNFELMMQTVREFTDLDLEWVGYQTSVRPVPYSKSAGRRLFVERKGRVIRVYPGKIENIFEAVNLVKAFL